MERDRVTRGAAIRIVSVAGQSMPGLPGGNTAAPDVVINDTNPLSMALATQGIPAGTRITVRATVRGQAIVVESAPVAPDGTATATLTLPAGWGTIQAYASYPAP